jgi:multiple antibiotic resistance protein
MELSIDQLLQIGIDSLYLLALINPISKVSILGGLLRTSPQGGFSALASRSSIVAVMILFGAMVCGDFLLCSVFHVKLYSLQLAGGGVLAWVGFNALRHGVFFEQPAGSETEDIALVPLACPMIAGPASITACIGLAARHGLVMTTIAMLIAVGVNYLIMLSSRPIYSALFRHHILGALIRITGLIVMTIGTQMTLDGIGVWVSSVRQ